MNEFIESNINFTFEKKKWEVVKYDEHLAHKNVSDSIQTTKAVDFLGIYDDRKLFFVEVKNYKGHTKDSTTQKVLTNGAEELTQWIALKVRDTIASATNAARFSTNDEVFFNKVNKILLNDTEKVVVIAWIEFDEKNEQEKKVKMGIWLQKLKQKLSWLHATKISVNSLDYSNGVLPDTKISWI